MNALCCTSVLVNICHNLLDEQVAQHARLFMALDVNSYLFIVHLIVRTPGILECSLRTVFDRQDLPHPNAVDPVAIFRESIMNFFSE